MLKAWPLAPQTLTVFGDGAFETGRNENEALRVCSNPLCLLFSPKRWGLQTRRGKSCEDTGGRRPPASPGQRPPRKPAAPAPCAWPSGPQSCGKSCGKMPAIWASPSGALSVMAAQAGKLWSARAAPGAKGSSICQVPLPSLQSWVSSPAPPQGHPFFCIWQMRAWRPRATGGAEPKFDSRAICFQMPCPLWHYSFRAQRPKWSKKKTWKPILLCFISPFENGHDHHLSLAEEPDAFVCITQIEWLKDGETDVNRN